MTIENPKNACYQDQTEIEAGDSTKNLVLRWVTEDSTKHSIHRKNIKDGIQKNAVLILFRERENLYGLHELDAGDVVVFIMKKAANRFLTAVRQVLKGK